MLSLPRIIDSTRFTYYTYLDLAGVVQAFLDLVRNIAGEAAGRIFVDFFRFHDDAYLAPGLDGEGFLYAGERISNTLKRFQSLDIEIDGLTTSARAGSRDGIGSLDDSSLQCLWLGIGGMVGNHGVNYLGRFSETTRNLTANDGMGTFDLLVDSLAHVMQ